MGKSVMMISWPITSVINNGGQAEAWERREGSAEDRRAALITGSTAGSFWPEARQGWKARQDCVPLKM